MSRQRITLQARLQQCTTRPETLQRDPCLTEHLPKSVTQAEHFQRGLSLTERLQWDRTPLEHPMNSSTYQIECLQRRETGFLQKQLHEDVNH